MIELDGSFGEGGGALVRTALALSTLTGQPFHVNNIRAGRKQPGLKAQHLTAITALKEMCQAKTNNIQIGTQELNFTPDKIKRGTYQLDIGTAGSISLLLQALILPCLFAPGPITLNVKGGSCGKWQASVTYLQNILLPQIKHFTKKIELKVLKRGYYPKGGAKVQLKITPLFNSHQELSENTKPLDLTTQGTLEAIKGNINLSIELEEKDVAKRVENAAKNTLKDLNVPILIESEYANTLSVGGEIVLWAICSNSILGSDALIEKGKTSEQVGKEATQKLIETIQSKAAADSHLTDQLIPYLALLPSSQLKAQGITNHTKTNIYVIEKFLNVKFNIENNIITINQ